MDRQTREFNTVTNIPAVLLPIIISEFIKLNKNNA